MADLTLAIPTFNADPEHMLLSLESIAVQTAECADRVRVVVVDNASGETSASALREFSRRYPSFTFHRYDTNLGFDRNVLRLLDSVDSRFVWFFGDDDILLPGALTKMLAALSATPDAVSVLSPAIFFFEDAEIADAEGGVEANRILRGDQFLQVSAFTAAAMSVFCVSSKEMRALDLSGAVGTNWVHFAALVRLCSSAPAGQNVLLGENLVAVRRSNSSRWFSNFGNQYRSGITLLSLIRRLSLDGGDLAVYEFFRRRRFRNNFIDILTLAWPLTLTARREIHAESLVMFGDFLRYRYLDAPLLFSPNWVKASGSAAIRVAGRVRRSFGRG